MYESKTELLRGKALGDLPVIKDAWLLVEGDRIAAYGLMRTIPAKSFRR